MNSLQFDKKLNLADIALPGKYPFTSAKPQSLFNRYAVARLDIQRVVVNAYKPGILVRKKIEFN